MEKKRKRRISVIYKPHPPLSTTLEVPPRSRVKEGEKRKPLEPFRECRPESEEGEQYINSEHPATWDRVRANIDFESIDKRRRKAGHTE